MQRERCDWDTPAHQWWEEEASDGEAEVEYLEQLERRLRGAAGG